MVLEDQRDLDLVLMIQANQNIILKLLPKEKKEEGPRKIELS